MAERTALFSCHQAAGARFIEFAGWEMPVHYTSIVAEHRAVRARAGMFDTSHMGQIEVRGNDAGPWLDWLLPNDIVGLGIGRARYSLLLAEDGGTIDDLMVYRLAEEEYLLVVNAAGRACDLEWLEEHRRGEVTITPRYADRAMIALQGPDAVTIAAGLADTSLPDLPRFGISTARIAGRPALAARTGYTGEDGLELFLANEDAPAVWEALLAAGVPPCGLGARDTLRLEAGLPLYGHELDRTTTPYEAGLGWTVNLAKPSFLGKAALLAIKAAGPRRSLIGFRVEDRGIARHGHPVVIAGQPVGVVTSGSYAPTIDAAIGMAYVPPPNAVLGAPLTILVRDKALAARIVPRPFYRRDR
ncbi:MAG: glycine cleavage system aminomethyltransferase GcvT [Chloroflexota bacterium]|nr:glycine cleavage system aminomethyltransferase GcvT [Dehalococcoidia bacterium]MDW8254603.1 glycine cleavage system aminomethyltransferase GcvT [Chloroflexota bacterium]